MPLTAEERAIYEWQMWVTGVGEEGQLKLKNARVLVSRVGGLGGLVALELAAAGVGKLVLAHGGVLQPSDLNRQLLQTHDHIGKLRIDSIVRRLKDLNPRCGIIGVPENASAVHADALVGYIPEVPPTWKRQFPVFGAVSGAAACIGAMEVIKLITGIGTTLQGELLSMNLETMQFRKVRLPKREDCAVCGAR